MLSYIAVSRGKDYVFAYTCNGINISIDTDRLGWDKYQASWFDPHNGSVSSIGTFQSGGAIMFDPPGQPAMGNDRVLILDRQY